MDSASHPSRRQVRPPARRPFDRWLAKPVIPVLSQVQGDAVRLAQASVLFLQGVELADLAGVLQGFDNPVIQAIPLLVHIDLLAGLNSDEAGVRFIAAQMRVDGIITLRPHLVSVARQLGLRTVLRMFLQDGRAVERAVSVAEKHKPDAIELLPGVAAVEAAEAFARLAVPRLAGGLIHSEAVVRRILDSGCRAISTSDRNLWRLNEAW